MQVEMANAFSCTYTTSGKHEHIHTYTHKCYKKKNPDSRKSGSANVRFIYIDNRRMHRMAGRVKGMRMKSQVFDRAFEYIFKIFIKNFMYDRNNNNNSMNIFCLQFLFRKPFITRITSSCNLLPLHMQTPTPKCLHSLTHALTHIPEQTHFERFAYMNFIKYTYAFYM